VCQDIQLSGVSFRNTHHVPEVGAESARRLVELHHAVIVENLSAAITKGERQSRVGVLRITVFPEQFKTKCWTTAAE